MNKEILFTVSQDTPGILGESFLIPHCCNFLTIKAAVDFRFAMMTYITAIDPQGRVRLLKLLGHGEREIVIGPDSMQSSLGAVPGVIGSGQWEMRIYVFTEYLAQYAPGQSFEVKITVSNAQADADEAQITETVGQDCWFSVPGACSAAGSEVISELPGWYKGDFHTHTHLSDGKESVRSAMKKADQMAMDFYVPTEHNAIHTGWPDARQLIIPGVEITTENGHMNLFGIDKMPEHLLEIIENMGSPRALSLVMATIAESRERGWLTSINHPFLHIWKWHHKEIRLADIDCLEIVNDPTYTYASAANDAAIRFLDMLWQDGHKIYGVGGSDSHNLLEERYEGATEPSIAGDPGTWVYSEQLSAGAILDGVRKGHVYVSRYCTVAADITCGTAKYLPGDEILSPGRLTYRLSVHLMPQLVWEKDFVPDDQAPKVYSIHNGQRSQLDCVRCENGDFIAETTVDFGTRSWEWMRFEVRGADDKFMCYVNPVYYGTSSPQCITFGDAAAKALADGVLDSNEVM